MRLCSGQRARMTEEDRCSPSIAVGGCSCSCWIFCAKIHALSHVGCCYGDVALPGWARCMSRVCGLFFCQGWALSCDLGLFVFVLNQLCFFCRCGVFPASFFRALARGTERCREQLREIGGSPPMWRSLSHSRADAQGARHHGPAQSVVLCCTFIIKHSFGFPAIFSRFFGFFWFFSQFLLSFHKNTNIFRKGEHFLIIWILFKCLNNFLIYMNNF